MREYRYVAVVGSRSAAKEDVLNAIKSCKLNPKHHVIVSGGCPNGADKFAREIAEEMGFRYIEAPAFWNSPLKKGAGMHRNSTIVDVSDAVIAVWDGQSPGTADTVKKAKAANRKLECFVPMVGLAEKAADE